MSKKHYFGVAYSVTLHYFWGFPGGSDGKDSAMQETLVRSLGWEDPLEKGKAAHSSILAWRIPGRAWWDTVHGVEKSQVRLSNTFSTFGWNN